MSREQRDVTALPFVARLRDSADLLDKATEFMDGGEQVAEAREDIALWREAADEIERNGSVQWGDIGSLVKEQEARAQLEAAMREIVDAAEALSRPGSQGAQHVNVARMTTAIQAGAALIGHEGIFPELAT